MTCERVSQVEWENADGISAQQWHHASSYDQPFNARWGCSTRTFELQSFLVLYSPQSRAFDDQPFPEAMERLLFHQPVHGSSSLIKTPAAPQDVFVILQPYLRPEDDLHVVRGSRPCHGFGSRKINQWLSRNLDDLTIPAGGEGADPQQIPQGYRRRLTDKSRRTGSNVC